MYKRILACADRGASKVRATMSHSSQPSTMRAVVLDAAPAPPSGLQLKTVPMPKAQLGQVLIRVKAFGLNRSELHTRHGFAGDSVTFPRILGIEAAGVVAEDAPGGEFKRDQKVVAITGGLGRTMDGGYAGKAGGKAD
jgi:NADPH2:quinone reductase